jgi:hypothetical protein
MEGTAQMSEGRSSLASDSGRKEAVELQGAQRRGDTETDSDFPPRMARMSADSKPELNHEIHETHERFRAELLATDFTDGPSVAEAMEGAAQID